jgi:metal-responsive CopG/Arc/MetJ family transcriptional regulator
VKTIAISIEQELLDGVDRIARQYRSSRRHGRTRSRRPNRSEVIRVALREFLSRQERLRQESADREALASHRDRLSRQLEALVAEQAEP